MIAFALGFILGFILSHLRPKRTVQVEPQPPSQADRLRRWAEIGAAHAAAEVDISRRQ